MPPVAPGNLPGAAPARVRREKMMGPQGERLCGPFCAEYDFERECAMTSMLTAPELVRYFEDRLRQIEREGTGGAQGREPQYPMLVLYLGQSAAAEHGRLSAALSRLWPQYGEELCYAAVELAGTQPAYFCPATREPLEEAELARMVTQCFGLRTHFQDRSRLLVYYVMDTTSMLHPEELDRWLPVIAHTRMLLGLNDMGGMELLAVLLNEDFQRRKTGLRIRNRLRLLRQGERSGELPQSVFLLSNRRSDNTILEDWGVNMEILASLIALSNNSDSRIVLALFDNTVKTVRYARQDKPTRKIGQIVVRCLVDWLEAEREVQSPGKNLLTQENLPERLGMTGAGTFCILDPYAESALLPLLLGPDRLELFPRMDYSDSGPAAELSARELDRRSMGAWSCYLDRIAAQARERVRLDAALRTQWKREYGALLAENFSTEELLELADHPDELRRMLCRGQSPAQDAPVLQAAGARLKYQLSSDPAVQKIFLDAAVEEGEKARAFAQTWNGLLRSRSSMFAVRDENITAFYERRMRDFFDRSGNELRTEFRSVRDAEELERFLIRTLNRILDKDAIYTVSFEEELEKRLRAEALPTDAEQYIREQLTGGLVHTYLQVIFSLGQPVLSAMLLKKGTPLHRNLTENLRETTYYYYDTGCSTAAEALEVYAVSDQNLISGEEE